MQESQRLVVRSRLPQIRCALTLTNYIYIPKFGIFKIIYNTGSTLRGIVVASQSFHRQCCYETSVRSVG